MATAGKTLALFDFDGTLTDRDSFSDFIRQHNSLWALMWAGLRLGPAVAAMQLGLRSRQWSKERVMQHFFAPLGAAEFRRRSEAYAAQRVPQIVRPQGLQCLRGHRDQGHRVVVISASPEDWIAPWCVAEGVECLATRLERRDGALTGAIAGENCRNGEKVRRLCELLDLAAYGEVHAYGDSAGDREMLAIADHPHFRPFRG